MLCVTIEPISIGGVRVEAGSEVELNGGEYLTLSKAGAIEPKAAHEARKQAARAVAQARAEAEAKAAKLIADAEAEAARVHEAAVEASEAKVDKTAAGTRARGAKPAEG